MQYDAEVAVIGLGAMGSSAAWRLAERGVSVIGIERYFPGHNQGSSHGSTRVFRVACLEHPTLVPIARKAKELWLELGERSGTTVLEPTGALMVGPHDSDVIAGTLKAAADNDMYVEQLSRDQVAERFPAHASMQADHVAVWDPEAGVVHPEAGVIAAVDAARAAGAQIYTDTKVTGIDLVEGGVVVHTPTRDFTVAQVVVTTGAWLGKFVPELPLDPWRTPMTWFAPKQADDPTFGLEKFPVFIRAVDGDNWIWGHGAGDGFEVKIGPDRDPNFLTVDPDTIDRYIHPRDHALVSELVEQAFPGLNPLPTRTTTCMVTHTPDGQFLLGRPHGDSRLIVGGGCSGHAFKHASALGELLAEITVGQPTFVDIEFMNPNRFASTTNETPQESA